MKLLNTDGGNTKIAKSMKSKLGTDLIRIASLSMMPDDVLCPSRHIAGCADTCLRSTGRGVFQNVIDSRQRKTDWWHADRDGYEFLCGENRQGLCRLIVCVVWAFLSCLKPKSGPYIIYLAQVLYMLNYLLSFDRIQQDDGREIEYRILQLLIILQGMNYNKFLLNFFCQTFTLLLPHYFILRKI